ncbi:hypothetical protein TW95_gp0237 [Pandoravirus inopinatum]|uniref:Uncharacterized protein n=1 Tax=Pandoravirus inopinatum TaxID=1605721 RepID=A0A0B5J853_9VIRU|nr:hypothetical protein TW95_gp0237 [Pandoravirus inopinatum]AJF96971.1 hypothetical protein [Pandoravirus inopinatum]
MQKDIALVGAALACVRDDRSVDLARLLLVEYEHNLGLLQGVVAKAGRRLDKHKQDPSYECGYDTGLCQMDLSFLSKTKSAGTRATTVTIARHDEALWSVRPDSRRMTDVEMAAWMAICARHCAFSFLYDAFVKECERQQPRRLGYVDYEEMPCFKHMWLASVARGLAGRMDAWTNANVTRTRSLCDALVAILDARIEGGPLAIIDTPAGDSLDQATVALPAITQEGDQQVMASMRGALGQVQYVKQQLGLTFLWARPSTVGPTWKMPPTIPVRCSVQCIARPTGSMPPAGICRHLSAPTRSHAETVHRQAQQKRQRHRQRGRAIRQRTQGWPTRHWPVSHGTRRSTSGASCSWSTSTT